MNIALIAIEKLKLFIDLKQNLTKFLKLLKIFH